LAGFGVKPGVEANNIMMDCCWECCLQLFLSVLTACVLKSFGNWRRKWVGQLIWSYFGPIYFLRQSLSWFSYYTDRLSVSWGKKVSNIVRYTAIFLEISSLKLHESYENCNTLSFCRLSAWGRRRDSELVSIFNAEFVPGLMIFKVREIYDRQSFDGVGAGGQTCRISQMYMRLRKIRSSPNEGF
jgi:hypothetical protein